jgi:hypothetical protein
MRAFKHEVKLRKSPYRCQLLASITLQTVNQCNILLTKSFAEGSVTNMGSFLNIKGQDEEGKGRGQERPALGPTASTPLTLILLTWRIW